MAPLLLYMITNLLSCNISVKTVLNEKNQGKLIKAIKEQTIINTSVSFASHFMLYAHSKPASEKLTHLFIIRFLFHFNYI